MGPSVNPSQRLRFGPSNGSIMTFSTDMVYKRLKQLKKTYHKFPSPLLEFANLRIKNRKKNVCTRSEARDKKFEAWLGTYTLRLWSSCHEISTLFLSFNSLFSVFERIHETQLASDEVFIRHTIEK